MNTFLVVEDDKQIRKFIIFSLRTQGYECVEAVSGQQAMAAIVQHPLCAVILDLGLPDMDGLSIIRQVREFSQIPIIVVSARDREGDKIDALDAGADDYLTKPFSVNELLARIRVILRHASKQENAPKPILSIGDLTLEDDRHRILLADTELHFTPIEYNILKLLMQNAGKVLTHRYILQEVWGAYLESDTQSLRVFMANIRRKIEYNPASPRYIFTEVGIGYRFAEE